VLLAVRRDAIDVEFMAALLECDPVLLSSDEGGAEGTHDGLVDIAVVNVLTASLGEVEDGGKGETMRRVIVVILLLGQLSMG